MIDNAPIVSNDSSPATKGTQSVPVSPNSLSSNTDIRNSSHISSGVDSLMVSPGITPARNTETDTSAGQSALLGGLSPLSPYPAISPSIRQSWLYVDSSIEMPRDVSEGLMDSMSQSVWSGNVYYYLDSFFNETKAFCRFIERGGFVTDRRSRYTRYILI